MSDAAEKQSEMRLDPFGRISFSQLGEDIIVCHLLDHWLGRAAPGFYIDVGAHHPRNLSNSAILHGRGWRGINVDADPFIIETFTRERPEAINLSAGVGLRSGVETFYRFDGGAVSTFDTAIRDDLLRRGNRLLEERQIVVGPLSDLLAPHLPAGQVVDYLNVDVEGRDLEALQTYDFDRHAPTIITVEDHAMNLHDVRNSSIFAFLAERRYQLRAHSLITSLYLRGA